MTSSFKVLSIGDQDENSTPTKKAAKYEQYNFQEDFKKHLAKLLVETSIPIPIVENWDTVEAFFAASVKEGNQPRRYYFYCGHGRTFPRSVIISGPTYRAVVVMHELKKLLSGENWVEDNCIEAPLRAKESKEYYNCDSYIQHMVSRALDAASKRLFGYIFYMQQQHINKNKKL